MLLGSYYISIAQDVINSTNPVPGVCTARLERTTSDGSNNFNRDNFRNCLSTIVYNTNQFTGRDDIYRLSDRYDYSQAVTIKMKATSNNRDLDLFVMNGSTCIASSVQPAGTEDIISFNSWNDSWRIIVDGYNSSQNGNYVIEVIATCKQDDTPPPATAPCNVSKRTILCNSSVRGDTRNETDNIRLASYKGGSCLNFTPAQEAVNPFTGNDVVYLLSGVDSGTPVTLRLNANTDLDMFIYRCFDGLGTHCISAAGATSSQNETITIEWNNNYLIIIDSPNPSQNGSYTLSAICADPCNNPKEENCNNIDYEYAGNGGNLAYEFRVSGLPANGSWTATRNGSTINLGTSSRVIRTFSTPGEYEICYRYIDADGCEKFCCKRININNPYNCNLINSTKQGNNYVLSLPGINDSDVECWLVLEGNGAIGCLEERRSRVTVPVPTGNNCVRYCVKYYDRVSRCYRVCCIEVCADPCPQVIVNVDVPVPDCDFITHRYNRNIGGLSYDLSVPPNLPSNGTWEARSESGTVWTIGSGRDIEYEFPFAGKFLVCYKYFDSNGCVQHCCRWIYIENPFDCNRIISTPNGNNNTLTLSGVSGSNIIKWIDDATGNVLNTSSSQITVPVPDPENCKYYSVIYFDPSCNCYRICCIKICGPDNSGGECCPDGDANLSRIIDLYRNICDCGVQIYCYNGNGFSGYYVYSGYLCCSRGTGTIFDCQGNIRGVESVTGDPIFNSAVGALAWDGCNNLHIEGPIGTEGPGGSGGQGGPSFLSDYPWLSDIVNFNNCSGTTIELHQASPSSYIYVKTATGGVLYNSVGLSYCALPNDACIGFYSNGMIDSWTCSNFTSDPCKDDPENCSDNLVIQNSQDNSTLKVYPNPSNGKLFIDFPSNSIIKNINLFDLSGQLIKTFQFSENQETGNLALDIQNEVSGMYLLRIELEKEIITKRIVLE